MRTPLTPEKILVKPDRFLINLPKRNCLDVIGALLKKEPVRYLLNRTSFIMEQNRQHHSNRREVLSSHAAHIPTAVENPSNRPLYFSLGYLSFSPVTDTLTCGCLRAFFLFLFFLLSCSHICSSLDFDQNMMGFILISIALQ